MALFEEGMGLDGHPGDGLLALTAAPVPTTPQGNLIF